MTDGELIRDAIEGVVERLDGTLDRDAVAAVRKALRRQGPEAAFDLLLERLADEQLAVPAAIARMLEVVARGLGASHRLAGLEVDGVRVPLTAAELELLLGALDAAGDPGGLCLALRERLDALTGGEPR